MMEYVVKDGGGVMMVGGKIMQELTRCKDCSWLIENGCGDSDMCGREGFEVSKTDFCSFAERRVET